MEASSAIRVVHGLEAIIDAAAGVLSQKSLTATLDGMVRELQPIVPFTSLAVYETDHSARVLVPVYAVGLWVEATLANRPGFDSSLAGQVVQSGEPLHLDPWDTRLKQYTIPGTPDDEHEAIVIAPLIAEEVVIGTLSVWREDPAREVSFSGEEEAQLIGRFATLAALAYANARQREQLLEQARTDTLTGLPNRRVFHERLDAELARSPRATARFAGALRRRRLQGRQRPRAPGRRRRAARLRAGAVGRSAPLAHGVSCRRRGIRRHPQRRRR